MPGENGEVVAQASANDDNLMNHVRSGDNRVGSGGMASKLSAAKIAARSGAHSFIVNGRAENCIARVLNEKKPRHFSCRRKKHNYQRVSCGWQAA